MVTDDHLAEGRVYPPLSDIQDVSLRFATEVGELVYREDLASLYPEPEDKRAQIWTQRDHPYYNRKIIFIRNWEHVQNGKNVKQKLEVTSSNTIIID